VDDGRTLFFMFEVGTRRRLGARPKTKVGVLNFGLLPRSSLSTSYLYYIAANYCWDKASSSFFGGPLGSFARAPSSRLGLIDATIGSVSPLPLSAMVADRIRVFFPKESCKVILCGHLGLRLQVSFLPPFFLFPAGEPALSRNDLPFLCAGPRGEIGFSSLFSDVFSLFPPYFLLFERGGGLVFPLFRPFWRLPPEEPDPLTLRFLNSAPLSPPFSLVTGMP